MSTCLGSNILPNVVQEFKELEVREANPTPTQGVLRIHCQLLEPPLEPTSLKASHSSEFLSERKPMAAISFEGTLLPCDVEGWALERCAAVIMCAVRTSPKWG